MASCPGNLPRRCIVRRQRGIAMDQPTRHLAVMGHHNPLPDPIQCRHTALQFLAIDCKVSILQPYYILWQRGHSSATCRFPRRLTVRHAKGLYRPASRIPRDPTLPRPQAQFRTGGGRLVRRRIPPRGASPS